MKIICCIPARLESTRLKRKLLLAETGKPLIVHTVEAALACNRFHRVVVAGDSQDLFDPLYGLRNTETDLWPYIRITGPADNGTARIGLLLHEGFESELLGADELIVHWQADEPEIRPEHIAALIDGFQQIPGCDMTTLASEDSGGLQWHDRSMTKVLREHRHGYAVSFQRDMPDFPCDPTIFRHIGIYAYRPAFLRWYASQPPSPHEQRESLEQLRALEAGCRIRVVEVDHPVRGIDSREDYDAFVARWRAANP